MPEDMLPKDIKLESVHTLQDDLNKASIKESEPKPIPETISVIKERNVFPEDVKEPSHLLRNILSTIIIVAVLVGGGWALFRYSQNKSKEAPVSVAPAIKKQELISYDSQKEINFSKEELLDRTALGIRIFNEARATAPGITFFKLSSSVKSTLNLLSPSIPPTFYRSLVDGKEFFGGYQTGNFIVLKTDSRDSAYAGMLAWESTMYGDLFPFFSVPSSENIARFEDKIVGNKDARLALDSKGNILFLYGFYDSQTILFAKNEEIFRSIQDMLLRQNL